MLGNSFSLSSNTLRAIKSCFLAVIFKAFSRLLSKKSEIKKAMALFFIRLLKCWTTSEILVRFDLGLNSISSLIILRICFLPFLGGIYNSILSENKIAPILSLFWVAEKANTAPISAINSRFKTSPDPKDSEPEISTINMTVSSLSSSKTFT